MHKIIHFVTRIFGSFWFAFAVLVALAVSLFWRGFAPGQSELEKRAGGIDNPTFQTWYATIRTEQEKAALRTTLDACSRRYGGSVWASHIADEIDKTGKPRFYDLAEMALSIDQERRRSAPAERRGTDRLRQSAHRHLRIDRRIGLGGVCRSLCDSTARTPQSRRTGLARRTDESSGCRRQCGSGRKARPLDLVSRQPRLGGRLPRRASGRP